MTINRADIYLGAGCFWGVQKKFKSLTGVIETEVGYAGGHVPQVNYEEVCQGDTGHAEVVKVVYQPLELCVEKLLQFFLTIHDSTQLDRQGPDVGRQYRSVIFYQTEEEKLLFSDILRRLSSSVEGQVMTTVERLTNYNRAEEYHQNYLK